MILCNKDCIPCCDFCIYAIHDKFIENGIEITGGPIGCNKHNDKEHQEIAESCGSCPDFHCFNVTSQENVD
jgi:hypothetical protein